MYAGANSTSEITSSVVELDNECSPDIPEWKKVLIMKKRAGNIGSGADEFTRRNLDSSTGNVNIASRNGGCSNTCDNLAGGGMNNKFGRSVKVVEQDFREVSPPKTVTIGNINVELRSVKSTPENQRSFSEISKTERSLSGDFLSQDFGNGESQDLQYGPGIVDRLRARFLNMGLKQQTKPVVRRFSSLENLPGSNAGPYRVNTRGFRQNGLKSCTGNVKKAQSMETLIYNTPEQHIFTASRRPSARYVGGVKGRILKNISPILVLTDENDEPPEKSPSPAASPRLLAKSIRRWDYNRSVSAPYINEDELPKPDTVKHVKKIFESPTPAVNCSEKPSSHTGGARFRKIPGTTTTSTLTCNNSAIIGSARPAVKKHNVVFNADSLNAKSSAKELPELFNVNSESVKKEEFHLTPEQEVRNWDDNKINQESSSPVLDDNLSANGSRDTLLEQPSTLSLKSSHQVLIDTPQLVNSFERKEDCESFPKVNPEQLPPVEGDKHSVLLSQGNSVSLAELLQEDEVQSLGVSYTADEGMVVAGGEFSPKNGGPSWQKAPPATTSIVFDFRGKDVKPNISLNPTPFGCRPAKVIRNNKRTGSPPLTGVNREDHKNYIIDEDLQNGDEEDWDEMDIGADLPPVSGIVFFGENVKVGRGALLEKRDKKLNIQFDDRATSTFEYPSENSSPSPREETESWKSSFNSTTALGSASNSRLGFSNYTPQVLTTNGEFELGVSQSNHRTASLLEICQKTDEDLSVEAIIPANPDNTGGWSATETADILF